MSNVYKVHLVHCKLSHLIFYQDSRPFLLRLPGGQFGALKLYFSLFESF